ncbi:MAG: nucleotidyltransferase [Flavobacteriaceae bacterium]|nr:nucleotidyltransferase [Flavobacteriaceae bacterium]
MSTSNLSFKDLATPHFAAVFNHIDEVMTEHGVPYYLIGATAIALEFLESGRKAPRGTKDIDFAMMVPSLQIHESIVASLMERGFRKAKAPWTLYFEVENIAIDLLPFGEIEENDTVDFNERYSDLHVLGFKEVLEGAKSIIIEEKVAKIPSLEGMVLLKLIAYSDRPEERENDIDDILRIIEIYYDQEWEQITESHFDLLDVEELDELKVAAEVLGRNSRVHLSKNKKLEERILSIVNNELEGNEESRLVKEWAQKLEKDTVYVKEIIAHFKNGLLYLG